MSVKTKKAEELRREKARNLRYKKAIHADFWTNATGDKPGETRAERKR